MPEGMPCPGDDRGILKTHVKKSCSLSVFTVTFYQLGCSCCRISDLFMVDVVGGLGHPRPAPNPKNVRSPSEAARLREGFPKTKG
jgi:hypothetical protein